MTGCPSTYLTAAVGTDLSTNTKEQPKINAVSGSQEVKVDVAETAGVKQNSTSVSVESGSSVKKSNSVIPVNAKDAWGIKSEYADSLTMHDLEGKADDSLMHGTTVDDSGVAVSNKFSQVGCKMTGGAKIISEATGIDVSLLDMNGYDTDENGLMSQEEIAASFRAYLEKTNPDAVLETDYWEKQLSLEKLNEIVSDTNGTTYVLAKADSVHNGASHWVVLTGYQLNDLGQVQFNYSKTSKYDELNNRTYILGEKQEGQNNTYTISKIETFTIKSRGVKQ